MSHHYHLFLSLSPKYQQSVLTHCVDTDTHTSATIILLSSEQTIYPDTHRITTHTHTHIHTHTHTHTHIHSHSHTHAHTHTHTHITYYYHSV